MPNANAAKKALRKSTKARERNRKIMNNLDSLLKKSRRLIEAKKPEAKEMVMKALNALDKATQKGVIKKNTRDRKKSRLHKKLNQIFK